MYVAASPFVGLDRDRASMCWYTRLEHGILGYTEKDSESTRCNVIIASLHAMVTEAK